MNDQPIHKTRVQETREATPVHDEFPQIDFEGSSLLDTRNIPPRPGFVQRWIRTKIRGEDDQSNVAMKMNYGWRPRLLDTIPKGIYVPKVDFNGINVVGIHGMILVERPAALHEKEAAYIRKQIDNQMAGVKNNMFNVHQEGHGFSRPSMQDKSVVTKGRLIDDD